MAELAAKYRDRAKERREGGEGQRSEDSSSSGAYHAVAPDVKGNFDAGKSKMVKNLIGVQSTSRLWRMERSERSFNAPNT